MMSKSFNIVVCGSARVGKSTLVNAIVGKEVARTSSSLNSITDEIKKYVLDEVNPSANAAASANQYSITIWDTPGIESWSQDEARKHFTKIMLESTPLCMIYCASPGSFARLDQLTWLIETCTKSNIFCALVCTNKYSGGSQQRASILNEFHSILSGFQPMTRNEDNMKYYGTIGLCTSVNSTVYEDRELRIKRNVEGVNELIFAITSSLRHDKAVAWCYAVANNDSFWLTMRTGIIELFNLCRPVVEEIFQKHGKNAAKFLIPLIIKSILKI